MKRLTILLSLALVFVLSMGAFAALNTNITGNVEMDITYKKDNPDDKNEPYRLVARTRARVRLGMSAGSSGNPKVTVNMTGADNNQSGWLEFPNDLIGPANNTGIPFRMSGWNMVATGALWKNGPSLTTTIGEVNRNWNSYTAFQLGENIIEVAGLKVGPLNVTGLYAYTRAAANYNKKVGTTGALRLQGTIDPITIDATVTNYGPQTSKDRDTSFYVNAKTSPAAGVDLAGIFAYDGENEGITYKAEATVKTIPNLTLTGLVRGTDDKFNPQHTDTRPNNRVWWADEQYYKVTASTKQGNVDLSGSYALATDWDGSNAVSTVEGSAKTTIDNALSSPLTLGGTVTITTPEGGTATTKTVIDANTKVAEATVTYKGTLETTKPMLNELTVERKFDLPFADGVTVNGKVAYQADGDDADNDPDKFDYGVDARWRLPNGMDIWVGYANYNKSGNTWVNGTGKDGFYIRVHRNITF